MNSTLGSVVPLAMFFHMSYLLDWSVYRSYIFY